jgi:hypothetical protein
LIIFGVISGTVLVFSSKIKMGLARLMRIFREKRTKDGASENEITTE